MEILSFVANNFGSIVGLIIVLTVLVIIMKGGLSFRNHGWEFNISSLRQLKNPFHIKNKPLDHSKSNVTSFLNIHITHTNGLLNSVVNNTRPTNNIDQTWAKVTSILNRFENKKTTLQMMSLLKSDPKSLMRDEHWRKYHRKIRDISKNKGSLARRLHMVHENDLKNPDFCEHLLNLMVGECLCNIRTRVYTIKEDQIQMMRKALISRNPTVSKGISMFDCATLTTDSGDYGVIFSDIQPFLSNQDSDQFSILDFEAGGDSEHSEQILYYVLRGNFFRFWDVETPGICFSLPEFYNHCLKLNPQATIKHKGLLVYAPFDDDTNFITALNTALTTIPSHKKLEEIKKINSEETMESTLHELLQTFNNK